MKKPSRHDERDRGDSITIRVGPPDLKRLGPNSKMSGRTAKGARKKQRHSARWCALEAMGRLWPRQESPHWEHARIDVTAFWKKKSGDGIDRDNLIASLKGAIDGITKDAGLMLNDVGLRWGEVEIVYGDSDPRVELTFHRMQG